MARDPRRSLKVSLFNRWTTAMPRQNPKRDDPQRARFIEAAKKLGADDDEAAFKAKLAVIARQKVKDAPEPPQGNRIWGCPARR